MHEVERLHADLTRRFPGVGIEIDPAETETGSWFVTLPRAAGLAPVVIEWRPDRGFGLSTPGPDDYGSGVDEALPDAKAAYDSAVRLALSGASAAPLRSATRPASANASD